MNIRRDASESAYLREGEKMCHVAKAAKVIDWM